MAVGVRVVVGLLRVVEAAVVIGGRAGARRGWWVGAGPGRGWEGGGDIGDGATCGRAASSSGGWWGDAAFCPFLWIVRVVDRVSKGSMHVRHVC